MTRFLRADWRPALAATAVALVLAPGPSQAAPESPPAEPPAEEAQSDPAAPPGRARQGKPAHEPAAEKPARIRSPDSFEPTEKIPADSPVSFPVDI